MVLIITLRNKSYHKFKCMNSPENKYRKNYYFCLDS